MAYSTYMIITNGSKNWMTRFNLPNTNNNSNSILKWEWDGSTWTTVTINRCQDRIHLSMIQFNPATKWPGISRPLTPWKDAKRETRAKVVSRLKWCSHGCSNSTVVKTEDWVKLQRWLKITRDYLFKFD